MDNTPLNNASKYTRTRLSLLFAAIFATAPALATEDEKPKKPQVDPVVQYPKTDKKPPVAEDTNKNFVGFKEIEFSEDFQSYQFVSDDEESEDKQSFATEDETFFVKGYEPESKASRDKERRWRKRSKNDCPDSFGIRDAISEKCEFRLKNLRDGFHFGVSAVSSVGDDFYLEPDQEEQADFNIRPAYRIQIAGLFFESPGMSTRRIHGLYASRAWGFNFYNTDNWSFDIFKQRDTKVIKDLEPILTRNKYRRAGLRTTGYLGNSQLQFIYSPYSEQKGDDDGIDASISFNHYWQYRNWNIYGSVGVQYQSEEVISFYESDAVNMEQRQERINHAAEIGFDYPLSRNWVLGGFVSYNNVESQIKEAYLPIDAEQENTGVRSGMHLSFIF